MTVPPRCPHCRSCLYGRIDGYFPSTHRDDCAARYPNGLDARAQTASADRLAGEILTRDVDRFLRGQR